jgi:hypothetical protein
MKRTRRCQTLAGLIVALCCSLQALSAEKAVISNDTVWRDTSGQEIWCNGGHMMREGDRFYWVGYETRPRTGFRNIKLYSSTNLVDWKFENNILRNEGPLSILGWAGRPGLLFNRTAKEYVVIFEADSRQWERHKVGFACCDAVAGNYKFVRYVYPEGDRSTGDQSVYQEQDEAYLVCTLDKLIEGKRYLNQSLAIFKLTPDYLDIEKKVYEGFDNVNGDTSIYPRHQTSREASHIIKVDGLYYWFSSGLQGWNSSKTMYATASSLAGPWSDLSVLATEPMSADSFNTQHDFVIPLTGTQTTTYVYVGDRYSQHHGRGVGRNIFLPLVWDGGVPRLTWCSKWTIDTGTGRWETVVPIVNGGAPAPLRPTAEIEEDVYSYEPADNGAGPMWCHGSTCLVHAGDDLFASGLETIPGAKPLNNCRWMLFQRGDQGWRKVCFDAAGRTREPSPLAAFPDGPLFLSANPTLSTDPNAHSGPARPELLQFDIHDPSKPAQTLIPVWSGQPKFTEHSYRSFAADGSNRELILFQNIGYTHAEWTFLDRRGQWSAQGRLKWPWGADYSKPQPIRVCYPNVALRNREVHFCGVSDIVEPNEPWRAFKKQLTGREWDYDFRRLFYTWSPDITTGRFEPWSRSPAARRPAAGSVPATCGWPRTVAYISCGPSGPSTSVCAGSSSRARNKATR